MLIDFCELLDFICMCHQNIWSLCGTLLEISIWKASGIQRNFPSIIYYHSNLSTGSSIREGQGTPPRYFSNACISPPTSEYAHLYGRNKSCYRGFKSQIGSTSHGSNLVQLIELVKGWIIIKLIEPTIGLTNWTVQHFSFLSQKYLLFFFNPKKPFVFFFLIQKIFLCILHQNDNAS